MDNAMARTFGYILLFSPFYGCLAACCLFTAVRSTANLVRHFRRYTLEIDPVDQTIRATVAGGALLLGSTVWLPSFLLKGPFMFWALFGFLVTLGARILYAFAR